MIETQPDIDRVAFFGMPGQNKLNILFHDGSFPQIGFSITDPAGATSGERFLSKPEAELIRDLFAEVYTDSGVDNIGSEW